MHGKKVLYVSSEVAPYLPETETSLMSFEIPKMINDRGGQTRIFMPRFGNINERRHQLHEVIRLSGMNLVINDVDVPLVIKVASIPRERMQVYFIDNDEYFKRKATFTDENGKLFPDNDERAIFFAKGVVETVKKLNWAPDIIHIQGWVTSLLPLYLREYYVNDPLFADSKIVMSVYDNGFSESLNKNLTSKIAFDGIDREKTKLLQRPTYENLFKVAVQYSDAVIRGSETLPENIDAHIKKTKKPVLDYHPTENFADAYAAFYTNEVLEEKQ